MQNNNNKKFLDNLVSRTKIYLIIILLLLIAISIQNTKFIYNRLVCNMFILKVDKGGIHVVMIS